jgi:serine/threonine-protein kinase
VSSLRRRRLRRTLTITTLLGLVAAWFFLLGPGAGTPLPSLVGLDQASATAAVQPLGVTVQVGESVFDEQVPAGTVLATSPGAGTRIKEGAVVRITLSKGPERYVVPDLVGMTVDQADAALAEVRLQLGERTEEFSPTVAKGRIISTTPAAGAQTRGGSIVNFVVSKGQELLALPDTAGMDADQAMAELADAGFAPSTTLAYSETTPEGRVIAQEPAPGAYPRGTAVRLTISMGSELVAVPSVKGLTLINAGRALENAGLTFAPTSPTSAIVTGQSVAAGTMVKRGTLIMLTVKK